MARVTVEDCVERIPNRFDLVMTAAQRSRNISAGAPLTVEADNDKNHVVSLREIAELTVDLKELEEQLIQSMQRHVEVDEPEEDDLDMISIQQEVLGETDDAPAAPAPAKAPAAESAPMSADDVFAKSESNVFANMDIDPDAEESAEEATPEVEAANVTEVETPEVETVATFADEAVAPVAPEATTQQDDAQTNEQAEVSHAAEEIEVAPESSEDAAAPEETPESQEAGQESGDSNKF